MLALAFTLASGHSAFAQDARSIGVNFSGLNQTVAPADQPGIAPGANWNNFSCPFDEGFGGCHFRNTGVGTGSLNDNSGTLTSATIQYSSAYQFNYFPVPSTANNATNVMYSAALATDPTCCLPYGEASITVSQVPYSTYDVIVYSGPAGGTGSVTMSISNGATTYYYSTGDSDNSTATSLTQTTSTDPLHPTAGPAQYQVFRMTSPGFTLTTSGSISGVIGNAVYGLQIVEVTPVALTSNLITVVTTQISGVGSSLSSQLIAVLADIDNNTGLACTDLHAFDNHVNAQTGKKITVAQAAGILATTASISAALNCQ